MKWIVEIEGGEAFPSNAATACRIAATGRRVAYLAQVFQRLEEALNGARPADAASREALEASLLRADAAAALDDDLGDN